MAKRKAILFRRLRVVRDDSDKTNSRAIRDVYLESSLEPWIKDEAGNLVEGHWILELSGIQMPCVQVVDLIKWAETLNVAVVYEPPQNMARWFSKKIADSGAIQYMFDIG